MYALVRTNAFVRQATKLIRAHPELRSPLAATLRELEADPFQPSLRLHALRGALDGYYAVRLTYSYRIVLSIDFTGQEIELLSVGSHDDLYR